MDEKFIQLEKDNVLRLGIKDANGNITGDVLEFDVEDIELPMKYKELLYRDRKNKKWLRDEMLIIEKRQDSEGDFVSKNDEDRIEAVKKFLQEEEKIYNLFLGENGVQKLLNGGKLRWTTFETIDKIIEKQILPHLNFTMENIADKVKNKYKESVEKTKKVLE